MTELEFLKEKVKLLERIAEIEREIANLKAHPDLAPYIGDHLRREQEKFWKGDGWSTSGTDNGKTQFSWTLT